MEKHTVVAVDIAKPVFEVAVSKEPGRVSERPAFPAEPSSCSSPRPTGTPTSTLSR